MRLRQGRLNEARDLLSQAETLNKEAGTRSNGLQIALAQGELALAEKRLPDAKVTRAEQDKALAVIESLGPQREEAHPADEKVNLLGAGKLRESVARAHLQSGNSEALWALLERMRLKEIRDQVPSDVWTKRLGLKSDDATDFAKLEAAARAKNEDALVPLFSLKPVTLAELQKERPNARIVVLRAFDEGVLVMIAGAGARFLPVKKTALLDALNAWDATLRALQPAGPEAQPLFMTLAEALAPVAGGSLLILGDGVFNRLPWAAVPMKGKRLIELGRIDLDLSGTHAAMVKRTAGGNALLAVGPSKDDALPYARMEIEDSVASFKEHGRAAKLVGLAELNAEAPAQL